MNTYSDDKAVSWPVVEKFLSPDEIADVLFNRVKDDPSVAEFIKNGPGAYHHGFGTGVRNEFYLWHPENPHTMKDYVPDVQNGADRNPRHADNTCGLILQKLHDALTLYRGR